MPRRAQRDVQVAQIDLTAMQEQYTKDVKAQVGCVLTERKKEYAVGVG